MRDRFVLILVDPEGEDSGEYTLCVCRDRAMADRIKERLVLTGLRWRDRVIEPRLFVDEVPFVSFPWQEDELLRGIEGM